MGALIQQELVSKRAVLLRQCMDHLGDLPELADLPGLSEWQPFLERSRDTLVAELQTPEPHPLNVSSDPADNTAASGLTAARDHGKGFANAMEAWPDICAAASHFGGLA